MRPTLSDCAVPTIISMAATARLPRIDALFTQLLDDTDAASLLMNQFQLLSLLGQTEFSLEMQTRALQHSVLYRVAGTKRPAIRLLAMLGAGDTRDNTPLDYLIENSDIQLDLLYLLPGQALPDTLPDHDVLLVALGVSTKNRPTLEWMAELLQYWPRPVLNRPEQLLRCSRDGVCQQLQSIPGLLIPPTMLLCRDELEKISRGQARLASDYPLTIRPLDSQGGWGLNKLEHGGDLLNYLDSTDERHFFVSRYIDYQSRDGNYRKWRIALINGTPYLAHLAISAHWIVHYNTAGMADSLDKREEEARCMAEFETEFAERHHDALRAIAKQLELDYVVLDCAETTDGKLLVFEADNRGWIHATDPLELFAYKQAPLQKLFAAFRSMLIETS